MAQHQEGVTDKNYDFVMDYKTADKFKLFDAIPYKHMKHFKKNSKIDVNIQYTKIDYKNSQLEATFKFILRYSINKRLYHIRINVVYEMTPDDDLDTMLGAWICEQINC
jgi:hypothetical protein